MAEKHGFQAPEGHRLCANNCGFIGKPATGNFCSKCYRDLILKEEQEGRPHKENPQFASTSQVSNLPASIRSVTSSVSPTVIESETALSVENPALPAANPNRCFLCRKRVGLTGFKCRCGTTFCGTHRYPEKHACTFDYKAVGRDVIARANPLVKADKLTKI